MITVVGVSLSFDYTLETLVFWLRGALMRHSIRALNGKINVHATFTVFLPFGGSNLTFPLERCRIKYYTPNNVTIMAVIVVALEITFIFICCNSFSLISYNRHLISHTICNGTSSELLSRYCDDLLNTLRVESLH